MKKLLPFLMFFIFSLTVKAQIPTLTYTNVTGSNTINCGNGGLNYIASVSNYTNGPVTYTWVCPSASASGTNVVLTNAGTYTLTAFNSVNSFSLVQTFAIAINTTAPQSSASTANSILTCNVPNTLLQGTSTNANATFSWTKPGPLQVAGDTLTVFTTAITTNTFVGTYTLTVTDSINHCTSTQSISIYQNIAAPSAAITGSNSVSCTSTITLSNASTSNVPPVFFPTLQVIGYSWSGPTPQVSQSNSSNYQAYTPGTYTLIALDLNNGCKATATKTITGTGVYPQVSSQTFTINCPITIASIYPNVTGNITGFTYSWIAPSNSTVSATNTATITTNAPGAYIVTVTSPAGCSTSTVVIVTTCSGIKQNLIDNSTVNIFPNPNNGLFTLDFMEVPKNSVIEIYSTTGVLVKKQVVVSEKTAINIQNEVNGLYFITILEDGKAIKVAKIVKN